MLTLLPPESVLETSIIHMLSCDHSNETSSGALSHGTNSFVGFEKVKFRIFLEILLWPLPGAKGLTLLDCLLFNKGWKTFVLVFGGLPS